MDDPERRPPALHDRALQDLSFIRRTMEGASAFTDVPGWGLVAVGATALGIAPLASRQPTPERWLAVWLAAAAIGVSIGVATTWRKMRRRGAVIGDGVLSAPARKFLLGFWPGMLAGGLLTLALADLSTPGVPVSVAERVLPGMWLLLYGTAVTTAGAHSVRAVPAMGLGFIALGALALLVPWVDGDVMMAVGFGMLQVIVGWRIARRHGG